MRSLILMIALLSYGCGKAPTPEAPVANNCSDRAAQSFAVLCQSTGIGPVYFFAYGNMIKVPPGFTSAQADECGWVNNGEISNGTCAIGIANGAPFELN